MGFFSGLDTEGYDRQYTDRELVRRIVGYFKPHKRPLIWVVILLFFIAFAGAIVPLAVSRAVNAMTTNIEWRQIITISVLILCIDTSSWVANLFRRRLTVRIVGDTVLNLRKDAFEAATTHDLSFYDEYATGKVVSRITSDTQEFGQMVVLITDVFSQIAQAVILGVILVSIDWKLFLVLMIMMPVVFLAAISYRKLARTVTRTGMRAMAVVNATIKETVSGIIVAKNFRQETSVYADFDAANRQSYRVNVRRGLVLSLVFPTLNAIAGISMALLVYFGGISVINGVIAIGAWFLFIMSLDRFFFPVQNLSAFWAQVQAGLSAAERVFALVDADTNVRQVADIRPPLLKGDIRFERVNFKYAENEPVLEDFNLHIRPGETVALVGHTGAGKTSIAKMIARFYEFQGGNILIDGQDIRSFNLEAYRSQLGIVSQVPFLFSGSVAENICYACPSESTKAEMTVLARQIGDGEWLDSLPEGLDTEVGERGSRLSMGQRQLVSLMRVLVQRPAIFILDEATASIDPFTEWQIQQALNLILHKTTSILIAHRLSTVKAADRIIVLDRGKIIEEGSHKTLLAQGGRYASLYNTYFRHQSLEYRPEGVEEFLAGKHA
jgi:ATP-binding cassette, subfamily B, bacterial